MQPPSEWRSTVSGHVGLEPLDDLIREGATRPSSIRSRRCLPERAFAPKPDTISSAWSPRKKPLPKHPASPKLSIDRLKALGQIGSLNLRPGRTTIPATPRVADTIYRKARHAS